MRCQDFGQREGCLDDHDDRFTMSFEDIGEGSVYWCTHCGPWAIKMHELFQIAYAKDPVLLEKLISQAEASKTTKQ